MESVLVLLTGVLAAYLIGSFPTAYIVTKRLLGRDIRTLGDGNMGAGNVWRSVHPVAGLVVGIVDAAKGAASVALAHLLNVNPWAIVLFPLAAMAGHAWPIALGFWGGGAAATAAGALLVLLPRETLLAVPFVGLVLMLSRHQHLAVRSGAVFIALFSLWLERESPWLILCAFAIPALHAVRVVQQERAKRQRLGVQGELLGMEGQPQ